MSHSKKRPPIKSLDEATPIQAAVLAEIVVGKRVHELMKKYGIEGSTINRWAAQFGVKIPPPNIGRNKAIPEVGTIILAPGSDIQPHKVQNPSVSRVDANGEPVPMGQQLMELLTNLVGALNAQAVVAGNPAWIERQDGSQLASVHRAMGDTALALTTAAAAGQHRQAEFDEEDREGPGNVVEGHVSSTAYRSR